MQQVNEAIDRMKAHKINIDFSSVAKRIWYIKANSVQKQSCN